MGAISRWTVHRPFAALLVWLLFAGSIIGAGVALRGEYNDSFELPDTDSSTAEQLLTADGGEGSGDGFDSPTAKIVWRADSGKVTDEAAIADATELLTKLADIDGVACVVSPLGAPIGDDCPTEAKEAAEQRAQQAQLQAMAEAGDSDAAQQLRQATENNPMQAQFAAMSEDAQKALRGADSVGVSMDEKVAFAQLTFAGEAGDITAEQGDSVFAAVQDFHDESDYTAGVSSRVLDQPHAGAPTSEIVGVAFALIIMMLAFGSVVASFVPVVSAVVSAGVGQFAILALAKGMDVATFAPMLAMMIGLGVGIDYALFVINRYQQAIAAGRTTKQAAIESVDTAGRAVVFAAVTVVIGIMGLLTTGVSFFTGLALAASSTVLLMMIGATFVLPAMMSKMGMGVFALRLPWLRDTVFQTHDHGMFARYGKWLEKNYKWFGIVAMIILLVVASPVASMRQGFADASGRVDDNAGRIAYDLVSEGFAEGINGPFVIAVDVEANPGDNDGVQQIAEAVRQDDGVAAALAVPMAPDATTGVIQLIPTTGPSNEATDELLERLREDVLPDTVAGTDMTAYVGGSTAIASDFTKILQDALPQFLAVVIGLGFLMLMLLFRSILVPLVGAVTSLLSLAASLGVTTAVFQWGWARDLLQVDGIGPIMPFVPIMVFAILFGLSMDYQVFLVSRMQEDWDVTRDNRFSIKEGLGSSGRVVAIAGLIMIAVFGAFIFVDDSNIKMFGLALASAVLFDAFLVRLVVVPSVMFSLGKANWWLPGPLQKILPKLTIESEPPGLEDPHTHDGGAGGKVPALAGTAAGASHGGAASVGVPGGATTNGTPATRSAAALQGSPQAFLKPPVEPEPEPVAPLPAPGPRSNAAAFVGLGAVLVGVVALAGSRVLRMRRSEDDAAE